MNTMYKAIALAVVISAGASAAQAGPVVNDLPRTESSITVHGIFDAK
jgi:hypothetical protein